MGDVLTTMKIMPDSPDVDLDAIKATIESSMPEGAKLHDMAEEPIAFGLVAIILQFITDDGEGGSEPVEEMVQAIDGVASIEITGVGRLM
ncbi:MULTISPECIES: elongation factor 1-beta [Methanobrevibacter]|uniref:elongation factor 1-beta n=1 Tax=Methanobrevibacter TaxID=2172 RepID=UPI0015C13AAC|nr:MULTISPECIES: elongation factor 1-beta [Methanobrevibacter]MBS7258369.1 elongation factor 1-beta [Methanobrevibacter sp.]MCI7427843.1 elongation factor 1-beta [Methanobrevibacter sp.]MDD6776609.1 elongation factor 1-beta [Methanobacteriaceae archaeon]MDY3096437.1 elongation factor 1-beta [Methanobrevibacter sp.]